MLIAAPFYIPGKKRGLSVTPLAVTSRSGSTTTAAYNFGTGKYTLFVMTSYGGISNGYSYMSAGGQSASTIYKWGNIWTLGETNRTSLAYALFANVRGTHNLTLGYTSATRTFLSGFDLTDYTALRSVRIDADGTFKSGSSVAVEESGYEGKKYASFGVLFGEPNPSQSSTGMTQRWFSGSGSNEWAHYYAWPRPSYTRLRSGSLSRGYASMITVE